MPSALYTISYKPTRSVVALCSFEKKHLADRAAWDRLLTTLVGARLPISMSGHGAAIEIAASKLGCDLVRELPARELESVLADPYRYRVSLDPAGPTPTEPGDGKAKVLAVADTNAVATIELFAGAQPQVKVTLAREPPKGLTTHLLFEGQEPLAKDTELVSKDGAAVSKVLAFELPLGVNLTSGNAYAVMFFMEGTPVEARKVTAVDTTTRPTPASAPKPARPVRPTAPVKSPKART